MKKIILLVLCLTVLGFQNLFSQTDTTKQDIIKINLAYTSQPKEKIVGAVDVISGDDLLKSTDYNVSSTLAGQASGLYVFKGNGGPGEYGAGLDVRGISTLGSSPLIVVDGVANRSLYSITVEEVESIVILKDPVTKMLYGSNAANGVVMVTTKRGKEGKGRITVSGEYGIKTPTWLPEYLNSADYAKAYRQAEINDGKTSLTYSEEDIAKYANGSSPLSHPDVDYYDTFLKDNTNYQRISLQLEGGSERTKYYLNVGYIGEGGLEAVGEKRKFTRLNVRSNLDYKVNDVISMVLDIAGRFDGWNGSQISSSNFFNTLSSHRPNDYPLFVSSGINTDSLGYSSRVGTNLYGELTRKGYKDDEVYYAQNNLGMNFDLNSILDGLSASVMLSFDVNNYVSTGKLLSYSRIRFQTTDDGRDSLVRVGIDDIQGTQERFSDNFNRTFTTTSQINYHNQFGKNDVNASLVGVVSRLAEKTGVSGKAVGQDDKRVNLGLNINYAFDNKYIFEGSSSLMGSDKFAKDQRWGLYGAAGFAWIMSNESFLESSSFIDYLKLKASYGIMGYDRGYDYLLDRDEFTGGGSYNFGINNTVPSFGQRISQLGNPQLTFEESKEINIGFEGLFFDNKLTIEANYFNELREGIPTSSDNVLPDYLIGTTSAPIINYNSISNKGIDVKMSYTQAFGDLKFTLGGNLIHSLAKLEKYSELKEYDHLKYEGKPVDVFFGFVAEGLYKSQAEIDEHGVSSSFSTIMPGDIKYKDITNDKGDNVINSYDMQEIGNYFPRISYALNLNIEYKNLSFYALGQGVTGNDRILGNYFQNDGQVKYSVKALGAAIPTDLASIENATHPRLTTENFTHSYRSSTYWLEDASFFKLRVVELSYKLPDNLSGKISASETKVFVKGSDLFSISKNDDMDPETSYAGINNYPTFRNVAVGLKVTF